MNRGDDPGELSHALGHEKAWSLLPWLANGTLEGGELEGLLDHLKGCRTCLDELRYLPELRTALGPEVEPPPEGPALARLLARIDAHEARQPGGLREWFCSSLNRRRAWLPRLAAAQAVLLVFLGGALLASRVPDSAGEATQGTDPQPAFRTLSQADPAPAGGTMLRLVFAPEVLESEVRALLLEEDAEIVAGPSARGVYTVRVIPSNRAPDAAALAGRLRDRSQVAFATPATGGRPGGSP